MKIAVPLPYAKLSKKIDWTTAIAQPDHGGTRMLIEPGQYRKRGLRELPYTVEVQQVKSKFIAYDVVDTGNFKTRYTQLEKLLQENPDTKINPARPVLVRSYDDIYFLQATWLRAGYAGAYIRQGSGAYTSKQGNNFIQCADFDSGVFTICDVKRDPTIEMAVAVFICEYKRDRFFEVAAPGSYVDRAAIYRDADKFIGKQILVKFAYYDENNSGVPMHTIAVHVIKDSKKC